MQNSQKMITGKCLCAAIEYHIEGDLGPVFNCHCSKCRRWHGAAFRTRASIRRDQFRIVAGADLLRAYQSGANVTKHFCNRCGSSLHSTYADKPNVIGVPLGGLDGVAAVPEAHIFVDSKASWYHIPDSLPQHPTWPGSEAKVRQTSS